MLIVLCAPLAADANAQMDVVRLPIKKVLSSSAILLACIDRFLLPLWG